MQAEYYGNGIAVFGETKTWKEDIKVLGGQFRKNLNGRPGWIFPRNKEGELMQFIANANAGVIQPTPFPQYGQQTQPAPQFGQAPLAPFGRVQPGMTPQAALARLAVAQPQQVVQPRVPSPRTQQVAPQPAVVLPTQPTIVNFPNRFQAADGLTYQIVMYTVVVPEVGQKVIMEDTANNQFTYIVSEKAGDQDIIISQVPEEVTEGTEPHVQRAMVIAGKWQIPDRLDDTHLTFLPIDQ